MQDITVSTLDYDLSYSVPSTPEEFDTLGKETGLCIRNAVNNVIYRSVLAEFRDTFTEKLAELTGIERRYRVVRPGQKDANGVTVQEELTAWDETEKVYVRRVWAELSAADPEKYPTPDAARGAYASLAQEVIASILFDPSKSTRESVGPRKTPKTYVEIADRVIELSGGLEQAVAKFNAKTGNSVPVDRDALANAIWQDQRAQAKTVASSYAQ
jgi:hypothetical protein